MASVVKRNGDKEPFDVENLRRSMQKAAIDAGCSLEEINSKIDNIAKDIAKEAKKEPEIETWKIREKALNKLDSANKSIADSWRKFDSKYKLLGNHNRG